MLIGLVSPLELAWLLEQAAAKRRDVTPNAVVGLKDPLINFHDG